MRLRQTRVDELATHAVVRTTGSGKDESRGVVAGTGEGSRGMWRSLTPQSVNGNMRYYSLALAPYNHVTIEEGEDGTPRP